MNEQIKLLADRLWRVSPNDIDAMGLNSRKEFYEQELTKFAESIIKECISIPYAMWDQAELNADVAVKIDRRIKDHFGVEE